MAQNGEPDANGAVICAQKDVIFGHFLIDVVLVGKAVLPLGFIARERVAPLAILIGGQHPAKQPERLVFEVDIV